MSCFGFLKHSTQRVSTIENRACFTNSFLKPEHGNHKAAIVEGQSDDLA